MRWIGVDPGEARVGIAACDVDERIAVPLEVVRASAAFPAIRAIVAREEAGGIVVGLPLLMDGREGAAAAAARKLGERLRKALDVPVEYEDERLTTFTVEQRARDAGTRPEGPHDDLAAALLLQQFIDRRRAAADHPDRASA